MFQELHQILANILHSDWPVIYFGLAFIESLSPSPLPLCKYIFWSRGECWKNIPLNIALLCITMSTCFWEFKGKKGRGHIHISTVTIIYFIFWNNFNCIWWFYCTDNIYLVTLESCFTSPNSFYYLRISIV